MAKKNQNRMQKRKPELAQKAQDRRRHQAEKKAQKKANNKAARILAEQEAAKIKADKAKKAAEKAAEAKKLTEQPVVTVESAAETVADVEAEPDVAAEPVIMNAIDPIDEAIRAFLAENPGAELTVEQKPVLDRMPVIKDHRVCTCGLGMGVNGCCQQTPEAYPGL